MVGNDKLRELLLDTDFLTDKEYDTLSTFLKIKEVPSDNTAALQYYMSNIDCLMVLHRKAEYNAEFATLFKTAGTNINNNSAEIYMHDTNSINVEIGRCRDKIRYYEGIATQQNIDRTAQTAQAMLVMGYIAIIVSGGVVVLVNAIF